MNAVLRNDGVLRKRKDAPGKSGAARRTAAPEHPRKVLDKQGGAAKAAKKRGCPPKGKRRVRLSDWTTPAGLERLEGLAAEGLGGGDIARAVGVGRTTLWRWGKKDPRIAKALEAGRYSAKKGVDYWISPGGLETLKELSFKRCGIKEMAAETGLNRRTLSRWVNDYPLIRKAVTEGCMKRAESLPDGGLIEKAVGYSEETIEERQSGDGVAVYRTVRTHPPDTKLLIKLLSRLSRDYSQTPSTPEMREKWRLDYAGRNLDEELAKAQEKVREMKQNGQNVTYFRNSPPSVD